MQQRLQLQPIKYNVARFIGVVCGDRKAHVRSACFDLPALGNGDAEISGLVFLRLGGLGGRRCNLDSFFRLICFRIGLCLSRLCAVAVHTGLAAASGKEQGHD